MLFFETFIYAKKTRQHVAGILTSCDSLQGRRLLVTELLNVSGRFFAQACEDLFYQMMLHLVAMGELLKENVFIDGAELEVCVNKYTFVWKKSLEKWET